MRTTLATPLLILTAALGCETGNVGSVPSETPANASAVLQESGPGQHSRECRAGDKVSCSLLARAYETGDRLPSGEIVGRDFSQAAYYHDRACALGTAW